MHLHTREDTPLAQPVCSLLGRGAICGFCRFDPAKRFGVAACSRNGMKVATGTAFHIPCLALENVNGRYDATKDLSRWPLVHPDMCKTLCLPENPATGELDLDLWISHWTDFSPPFHTIFPPTNVLSTRTSLIFAGSMVKMSVLSKTMSASLPGVIEPLSIS